MITYKDIVYDDHFPDHCKLDIYLPENAKQLPVYLYIHGGGLEAGDKTGVDAMAQKLTENGMALVSINYRMYPQYHFPDYLNDAAAAVQWVLRESGAYAAFSDLVVGGTSAGGYISMMLYFNPGYLANRGVAMQEIKGWFFDAGQPTTHFNVLKYDRGLDSRCVLVDDGAPLYYLRNAYAVNTYAPHVYICCSSHDMVNRCEQLRVLHTAMLHFGFPAERLQFKVYECEWHCGYMGWDAYLQDLADFIKKAIKE